MNLYKEKALSYFHKGINAIPDKFMQKRPAILKWTDYCHSPVSKTNISKWCESFDKSNIAIPLGDFNNLCVVDVDTTDQKLIEFLSKALPYSPVERIGSKGFVRFYRGYPGISSYMVKDANGNVVFEILAKNKKVTIPPSVHPAGMQYKWVEKGLLDLTSLDELPILPPLLIQNVEHMLQADFPDKFGMPQIINARGSSATIVNGRTDGLKKLCFQLVNKMDKGEPISTEKIADQLVKYDVENHEVPLFGDLEEQSQQHTHKFTNALKFVVNMIDYVQSKRFREKKMYTTVNCGGFITAEEKKIYEIGVSVKFDKNGNPKPIKSRRVNYEWD